MSSRVQSTGDDQRHTVIEQVRHHGNELRFDGSSWCVRQLRTGGRQRCEAQELHGLPPRQILRRGLPEGPPQDPQEGLQETRGRIEGRETVQPGARETGGGLLPNMHTARTNADRKTFQRQSVLHEDGVRWLFGRYSKGH